MKKISHIRSESNLNALTDLKLNLNQNLNLNTFTPSKFIVLVYYNFCKVTPK